MNIAKTILTAVITLGLFGLLLTMTSGMRPDQTDEMCRVRLLRLGEAVALYVEDRGGAAFPQIRNTPPYTLWQPGLADAASELLRPYLGGTIALPAQAADESREVWLQRIRQRELSVCPATGFAYVANNEVLSGSPSGFSRTGTSTWIFRCQGSSDSRGCHPSGTPTNIHVAMLSSAERSIPRQELDDLTAQVVALREANELNSTIDSRRRLDALTNRLAALERTFADGRSTTTVRRLTNSVTAVDYPLP